MRIIEKRMIVGIIDCLYYNPSVLYIPEDASRMEIVVDVCIGRYVGA